MADRSRSAPSNGPKETARTGRPVADILPDRLSLPAVRKAAAGCRACHLYARATQTVFGEGPRQTSIMMVGEQPGDVEDIEGHPFLGPAGRLLDRALEQVSIDRRLVYLTKVSVDRGRFLDSTLAPLVTATVHPSSILRARDDDSRREAMDQFVADLRIVAAEIARAPRDRAGSR